MWLVADFENVVARHEAKARERRLKVINCLTHIAFGGEDERCQAVIVVFNLFASVRRHAMEIMLGLTFSISQISKSLFNISVSRSFAYLRMAQRLCIGSMILLDILHARQNRVVLEKISIVRRKACWAPPVILHKLMNISL